MDNRELSRAPQFPQVASLLRVLLGALGSFAADPGRSLGFKDGLGSSWDGLCWSSGACPMALYPCEETEAHRSALATETEQALGPKLPWSTLLCP